VADLSSPGQREAGRAFFLPLQLLFEQGLIARSTVEIFALGN
jgi:hypothetical protein